MGDAEKTEQIWSRKKAGDLHFAPSVPNMADVFYLVRDHEGRGGQKDCCAGANGLELQHVHATLRLDDGEWE